MEFSLDLFINKKDIKKLGLSENLIHWGEETFSHDPKTYNIKNKLIFEKNKDNKIFENYYCQKVDKDIKFNDYIGLRLLGEDITKLEWIINKKKEGFDENNLIYFFEELCDLSQFIIFFIRNGDEIDSQIYVSNKRELINVIYDSLDWNTSSGGVVITKV